MCRVRALSKTFFFFGSLQCFAYVHHHIVIYYEDENASFEAQLEKPT